MPASRLLALALSLTVTACAGPWLGADARIHVSGKPAVIPSEQIPQLRGMWSSDSITIARTSGFSESYWLSAMDLIARMTASSDAQCSRLQLLSVLPRPATEFVLTLNQGEDSKQTVVPTRVEEWQLEACGARSVVRVFDNKLKPDMKVGVSKLRER